MRHGAAHGTASLGLPGGNRRGAFRIGYASQTESSAFAQEVPASIRQAADCASIRLVFADNRASPLIALKNGEKLATEGVNLVEFPTFDSVAPLISSTLQQADIPIIAIDYPASGRDLFLGEQL